MSDGQVHSAFGGSSAPRYMNCVGSTALNATLVAPPSDKYATGGSVRHKLAELCLGRQLHPTHFLDAELDGYPGLPVDQAMCDDVVTYLNAVETEIAKSKTAQYFVEHDIAWDSAATEPGEVFGQIDCMVYHPQLGRLRVFDFKGGFQEVEPETEQLKFYAALAVFAHPEWKLREVVLTIVQPGTLAWEDVRDWTFDTVDLLEFRGDVDEAIAAGKALLGQDASTLLAAGALKPGVWCGKTYCTAYAAGKCPAVEAAVLGGMGLDFGEMKPVAVAEITPDVLPDVTKLDAETLAKVVNGLAALTAWANRCQQYLESMVLSGAKVPGWKAVEKIGRAKWIEDPNQIVGYASMLFDLDAAQMMPPKLITITDAEKLLKAAGATKVQLDDFKLRFTIKESSGLTIAPASDRRPAADPVAADFGSVNVAAIAAE